MTTAAVIGPKTARSLLETACSRNLSAELHGDDGDNSVVARLRLLLLQNDLLCTDTPHFSCGSDSLQLHQHVVLYFIADGTRYMFRSRVARPRMLVDLNAEQRVLGMGLQVPSRIQKQQRRSAFRVTVARQDLMIRFWPPESPDDEDETEDGEFDPFEGRITNLSAGGLGAIVAQAQWNLFALGQQFIVHFELPEVEEPFAFGVEVRNFRKLSTNQANVVGLRFLPSRDPQRRADIARINRFVAAEERRQLRARK